MTTLQPWSVNAANLAEHADNAIHTDAGARAAGFAGALVAGVTTYAYLTHAPVAAWGMAWLTQGGAEVRFRHPVLDADRVDLVIGSGSPRHDGSTTDHNGHDDSELVTATVDGEAKADARFVQIAEPLPRREGPTLEPIGFVVDTSWSDYGLRAGDDSGVYAEHAIAHATSWPRIANQFCHEQLVEGSWIHVRSRIAHHDVAPIGSSIHATAIVAERFDSRAGERAVLDVRISANDVPVASIEHEAIIRLHA